MRTPGCIVLGASRNARTWFFPSSAALGLAVLVGAGLGGEALGVAAPAYLSPQDIVADAAGTRLFVGDVTGEQVLELDPASGTVVRTLPWGGAPGGLAVAPGGQFLVGTIAGPDGEVLVVDLTTGKTHRRFPAGHTPVAPVLSPDGKTVYVCVRFEDAVLVLDVDSGTELARIPVTREPIAAALTPDGKRLFVANHLPAMAATEYHVAASVSVIDTAGRSVVGTVVLPNGSNALKGVCVSPDGRYAYVTHILGRYALPTTQLERGWMNTNALSILDATSGAYITTVLLDEVDRGAANPWGVQCSADGRFLAVAQAGTHDVSIIDRKTLHDRVDKVRAGEKVTEVSATIEDLPNDLAFLVGLRRRLPVAGSGPRGLATAGGKFYVAEYFSGGVGVVDPNPETRHAPQSLVLGEQPEAAPERNGEMYFFDGIRCFQHWQSCSSCHPDARVDALNWDLLNDGMGNPKNSKSMLDAHATPPAMSTGVRDQAQTAVRAGIRYIQFATWPEEEAAVVDAYLSSLQPVPSPRLVNGDLSTEARRGKAVFESAGCIVCHSGPHHTNLQAVDLGTGTGRDEGKAFDTPGLREAWRTGPYLHDGRAPTLRALFETEKHGLTGDLPAEDLNALVAYVGSL